MFRGSPTIGFKMDFCSHIDTLNYVHDSRVHVHIVAIRLKEFHFEDRGTLLRFQPYFGGTFCRMDSDEACMVKSFSMCFKRKLPKECDAPQKQVV